MSPFLRGSIGNHFPARYFCLCLLAFSIGHSLRAQEPQVIYFTNQAQMDRDALAMFRGRLPATNFHFGEFSEPARDWILYFSEPAGRQPPIHWVTNEEFQGAYPGTDLPFEKYGKLAAGWSRIVSCSQRLSHVNPLMEKSVTWNQPKYVQLASIQVNIVCADFVCRPPDVANSTNGLERFIREVLFPATLAMGMQVDQGNSTTASLIDGVYADRANGLQAMVVAVGKQDERGRFVLSGSGFVIEDRLYTCAHVLAKFFVDQKTFDVARQITAAILFRTTNGYADSQVFEIQIDRKQLLPESDIAVVPLSGKAREKAMEVDAVVRNFYTTEDYDNPIDAELFVWGVQQANPAKPVLTKAEFCFPRVIHKRVSTRVDPMLGYAFRQHVMGLLWLEGGLSALVTNANGILSRAMPAFVNPDMNRCGYTECLSPSGSANQSCTLVYIPKDENLLKMVTNAEFGKRPRIECFGTGLFGMEGLSGSPVFRKVNGLHRLLGIYAGISERNVFQQSKPTLDCFGKVIPFSRVKDLSKK